MAIQKLLEKLSACREGSEWVGDMSASEAWDKCERGDWMLWIVKKQNVDIKTITMAKVRCARLVQHLTNDYRSLAALVAAERFANGEITREELAVYAADAAYAATSDDVDDDVDDDAAVYAADAAYAATSDADAVYVAAAASAAAAAAAASAASAARKDTLSKCADICRETIPFESLNIKDE